MMTLKEMDAQEARKRERMRKHEVLTREVANAKTRLASVEAALAQPDPASRALESVLALIDYVPSDLVTRGNALSPGGFNTRDTLKRISSDALADVIRKRSRLAEDLPRAQQKLAEAETALSRFYEANPEVAA